MNTQRTTLQLFSHIYEFVKGSKLDVSTYSGIDVELNTISKYLSTSKKQALFTVVIFGLQHSSFSVEMSDIVRYLKCSPLYLLEFKTDFDYLIKNGICINDNDHRRRRNFANNTNYLVSEKVVEAIVNGNQIPTSIKTEHTNITEVLEEIYSTLLDKDDDYADSHQLFEAIDKVIEQNLRFPLIQKIKDLNLSDVNIAVYYSVIWRQIIGTNAPSLSRLVEGIIDRASSRVMYIQTMVFKQNKLVKEGLIEVENDSFFNDSTLKLTEKSKQILNENGAKLFHIKKENKGVIEPKDIAYRELFFGENEANQLELIEDLLADNKLTEVQERLDSKGMPIGMAILLHGVSGTGKTESVMQIAKETNRQIMKVDISSSKSKWFGDSEKVIKRIFTDYQQLLDQSDRVPILLFNEADAILSTRKSAQSSNVAQTENAMQNILLEEFENFKGILFATTNLADNLDSAFERRFLFKVKFDAPALDAKAKIWKLKMPKISLKECRELANKFEFTGGQIDNVCRKCEINEVIHGGKIGVSDIVKFCEEESINTGSLVNVIGF